jgi:hypothetical protein
MRSHLGKRKNNPYTTGDLLKEILIHMTIFNDRTIIVNNVIYIIDVLSTVHNDTYIDGGEDSEGASNVNMIPVVNSC